METFRSPPNAYAPLAEMFGIRRFIAVRLHSQVFSVCCQIRNLRQGQTPFFVCALAGPLL